MKQFFLLILLATSVASNINGQNRDTDSLKHLLKKASRDTNRVNLLLDVANTYYFSKPDSCLFFSEEALELASSLSFNRGMVRALNYAGEALRFLGNYPRALKMQLEAAELNRKMKDRGGEATSLGYIGFIYVQFTEFRQGLQYLMPALKLSRQESSQWKETFILTIIGYAYDMLEMPDSALSLSEDSGKTGEYS